MLKYPQWQVAALAAFLVGSVQAADRVKASDHPLVGRFQGSDMLRHEIKEFESYQLVSGKISKATDGPSASVAIEGRLTRAFYQSPADRTTVEVMRAYEESLTAKRMEVIFRCSSAECGGRPFNHGMRSAYGAESSLFAESYGDQRYLAARLARPEGDIYVAIYTVKNTAAGGSEKNKVNTVVDVLEVRSMQGKIEFLTAEKMAAEIGAQGRVALYGIYFDTAKADVKPESAPTLEEISKFLKSQSSLRLNVVGHTDNQGTLSYNLDLSKRRAEAVVRVLSSTYGIGAERLAAHGAAFLAPVATNKSDAGRAKNRRVELSEQ